MQILAYVGVLEPIPRTHCVCIILTSYASQLRKSEMLSISFECHVVAKKVSDFGAFPIWGAQPALRSYSCSRSKGPIWLKLSSGLPFLKDGSMVMCH